MASVYPVMEIVPNKALSLSLSLSLSLKLAEPKISSIVNVNSTKKSLKKK